MSFTKDFNEQLKPLMVVLAVSILGFIANLYPVPLFANIHLILGNVAFVIVAMRFGVLYSSLSAVIVATAFVVSFGHPFGYGIFVLEAIVLAYLRKRGWYVLYADIAYWLVIGMPLTAFILNFVIDAPGQIWMFATVKQGFNGLIYACLAGLVVYFFPKTFAFSFRQQPRVQRSFKVQLVYATTLIITFSVMTTSIFVSQSVIDRQHSMLEKSIVESRDYILWSTNNMLDTHRRAVTHGADFLSQLDAKQLPEAGRYLQTLRAQYPQFRTMALTNSTGDVVHSSPEFLLDVTSIKDKLNISFREYFQRSMNSFEVVVSNAMVGQGFGNDPIVTFSKSFKFKDSASNSGIIQGALNLHTIEEILPKTMQQDIAIVVTDDANKIIYASPSLNVAPLTVIDARPKKDITFKNTGLVELVTDGKATGVNYFLSQGYLSNGWQTFVLLPSISVMKSVEKEYLLIFYLLFLAFLISISLAHKIGKQITRPLKFIIGQLHKFEQDKQPQFEPLYPNAAKEIITLYDEMQLSKKEIFKYQQHLQEKVEQRTEQLEKANDKLKEMAQRDGLTGVFNRRHFEETFALFKKMAIRNKNDMALVLIDLDHFKMVNDTYGHVSGDLCLQTVSSLLAEAFSRDTDLIARYGGEEFVILINHISQEHLAHKLEKLRLAIQSERIIDSNNKEIKLTASFGAILAPASFSADVQSWLKLADLALYKAKRNGRNQVHFENMVGIL
ncbi:diguanylate cyclase [Thalassotalea sp. Y01]|uniref:sensor domain-containing diguanylate cyclase n=1 Tax=Thalassotalea sp. Y01 TaxID=2729613 RepID=UPI00145C6412|nr:diguanylate cyclase [Thalassotalea sp. Y01]NMP15249.1 diguanylate cyclase [Thalassotalea sp. Y01]